MTSPKMLRLLSATSLSLLPMTASSYAAEWDTTIGATGLWHQSYVAGEDDEKTVLPYINVTSRHVTLSPKGLGVIHSLSNTHSLSALVTYRRSPVDVDENSLLSGFTDRDNAVELALQWTAKLPFATVNSTIKQDVSNQHNGYEAKVKVSKPFKTPVGLFIPAIGVAYQSDKLVDYYYGVSPLESSAVYPAYEAEGSIKRNAELTHIFPLGDHWQTVTNIRYTQLGSGLKNSPIVERSDVWGASLTVAYKF